MTASVSLYDQLVKRDGKDCMVCGRPLGDRLTTHVDRVVEGKDGGEYVLDNCRLLHAVCHQERHGNKPNSPYPALAALYRGYKFWQEKRNSAQRAIASFSGDMKATTASPYFTADMLDGLSEIASHADNKFREAEKAMHQGLRSIPVAVALLKCPGVGEPTLAMLLSSVDIRKADTVSSLWKFLGYVPTGGKIPGADKKRNNGKGKRFHAPLYAALSIALLRPDSPYRALYDKFRADLEAKREADKKAGKKVKVTLGKDGEPIHFSAHGPALFRTIKVWLSHLWVTWRKLEGLPTESPWIDGKDGHSHMFEATDFGWPEL